MADMNELYTALRNADAAGDTAGARRLADYIKSLSRPKAQNLQLLANGQTAPVGSPEAAAAMSPTADMSGGQRFVAGMGAGMYNTYQGIKQTLGLADRTDVANTRALQAPLLATSAGKVGNFAGTAASLLPAAIIPGANTMAGAAAIGAGTGLLQPSTSTTETLTNIGLGGVSAPAGLLAGRLLGAGAKGVYNLASPFFEGGQERLASDALQRFVGNDVQPNMLAGLLRTRAADFATNNVIPGLAPTTAELAQNTGLAQLERSLRNINDANNPITNQILTNRNSLIGAINSIAQKPADRAAAEATRDTLTSPLYAKAAGAQVPVDDKLMALLNRPSMQRAWERAQTLASERGDSLMGSNLYEDSVKGNAIQYLRMALKDMVAEAEQRGIGAHEQGALKSTLGQLNQWTENNVPALAVADRAFARSSIPINQMDIGTELAGKLAPALSDFGGTGLTPSNYANAVRNGDTLAARVTGNPNATLESTLSPSQNQTVQQVGQQLARRFNADNIGRAPGSNTAQNLISQNLLEQVLGPLGLPSGWSQAAARSAIGQTIAAPFQWATKFAENKVLGKLTDAALEPATAARMLENQRNERIGQWLWDNQGMLNPLSLSTPGAIVQRSQ